MATGNPFTTAQAPLAMQMIAPDIAAQQQQLTRQQQIAQALMSQGMAPGGGTQMAGGYAIKNSPLEGINKLAQTLMGAYGQKQADQKQLDLSKALQGRMADILGGGNGSPQQPAIVPPSVPFGDLSSDQNAPAAMTPSPATPMPVPAQSDAGMPAPNMTGNPAPMPAQTAQSPVTQPQGSMTGNNFNMSNLIRGQVISAIGGDPAASAYWKGMEPTDISRMGQQGGLTPQQIQAANASGVNKATLIPPIQARAGSTMLDPRTNLPVFNAPHIPDGYTPTFGADGKITGMNPIPGALGAIQASTQATASGKAAVTPMAGVDADGNPVYTNALAASGGGAPTASAPVTNTGPFAGYKAPGAAATGVAPGARPGVIEAANTIGKANADNYIGLQTLASSSPDRINTLDNMVQLASGGTAFGPGTSGRLDLIAGINSRLPSSLQFGNDDTANVQVFQKYASNLSQQYQKALGGTGTDAQLANVLKGTPSPDMMNKAITEVVPILKAQELALQAKSSAASDYMAAHNNNPVALNVFENSWRKNYDPRIYQMSQMGPADRAAFFAKQPDAAALKAKAQYALTNGYVQP